MGFSSYQDLEVWQKAMDLETHVLIAERLGYINENHKETLLDKTAEVGKMINGLKRSIEKKT